MSLSAEVKNERLRSQLLNLGERFIGFDKVVEAEAIKAKRVDGERNAIVLSRVSEAEKLVYAEIRARTEGNKQFQSEMELFCNTVLEKMQNRVARRIEKLLAEIEMMNTRCVTLERGQQQFRGELPSKLQVDTAALVKEMNTLKTRLQEDVSVWRAREEAVIRKIDVTMKNIFVTMEKADSVGSDLVGKAKNDLHRLSSNSKTKNDIIISEISQIRQQIQLEEEHRKLADSEILTAINSYTGVLQKGLRQVVGDR